MEGRISMEVAKFLLESVETFRKVLGSLWTEKIVECTDLYGWIFEISTDLSSTPIHPPFNGKGAIL